MSRPLSQAARTAIYSAETDEVFLVLLRFDEASLSEPIRVVHNNEDIVSRGETYVHFQFGFEFPAETGDAPRAVRIQIDAVDRQIIAALRAATGQPEVHLEVVLASDPDTVEAGPWVMQLENATYDSVRVSGEINFAGVERTRSANHTYTPHSFPDLY